MRDRKRTVIVARQVQVDDHFAGHIVAAVDVSPRDTVTITTRLGNRIRKRGGTTMSVYREITDAEVAEYETLTINLDRAIADCTRQRDNLTRDIETMTARRARYAAIVASARETPA